MQPRQRDTSLLTGGQLLGRHILETGQPHGVQRCPGELAAGLCRRLRLTAKRLIPGKVFQGGQGALDAGLVTQIEQ